MIAKLSVTSESAYRYWFYCCPPIPKSCIANKETKRAIQCASLNDKVLSLACAKPQLCLCSWSHFGRCCNKFQPDFRSISIFKKKNLMFYLFLRQREQSMSGDGAERGGDTESEAGSGLQAVSTEPEVGLKLTNCEIMT